MPSGKVHAITTVAVAGTVGPLLLMTTGEPVAHGVAFMAGCLVGVIVTPDLDVDRGSRSHKLVRQSTGSLGATLWRLFWYPYAWLIPHRSPVSHWPILGTALRVIYILAVSALIWWVIGWVVPLPPLNYPTLTPMWLWGIAGLAVVDGVHAFMDMSLKN